MKTKRNGKRIWNFERTDIMTIVPQNVDSTEFNFRWTLIYRKKFTEESVERGRELELSPKSAYFLDDDKIFNPCGAFQTKQMNPIITY